MAQEAQYIVSPCRADPSSYIYTLLRVQCNNELYIENMYPLRAFPRGRRPLGQTT